MHSTPVSPRRQNASTSPEQPASLRVPASLLLAGLLAPTAWATDPVTPPVFSDSLQSTNVYAPFEVGAYKVSTGKDGNEDIVVIEVFSHETRDFTAHGQRVSCHLLVEVEFAAGALVEISRNWFAEADDGTVYYFGETVDDYEDGVVVDHGGSWLVGGPTEAGDPPETAAADVPAVFMPAEPEPGQQWKPEDLFPLVDETVTALDTDEKVKVPAGRYKHVLEVLETSELPGSSPERKWYAPGVGVIKAKGDGEKLVLVASTLAPPGSDEGGGGDD